MLAIVTFIALVVSSSIQSLAETHKHNGHEYVDLGLSVKWATCNVGATTPGDYGNYYAWGETFTKEVYGDSDDSTNIPSDAARADWGGEWRLPTKEEIQELLDNCTWIREKQDGHDGYRVTSKKNGNSIFLPAGGYRNEDSLDCVGNCGCFWSSTSDIDATKMAYYLDFALDYYSEEHQNMGWGFRYFGRNVRPVIK